MTGDIIEWDVRTWKRALTVWEAQLPDVAGLRVLEVGSRHGGISLYWALRGAAVVCSDRGGPTDAARALHARRGVAERVTYADVDATRMPFGEGEFDVVCFKSVLGGIGGALGWEGQQQAVSEMRRVLRIGGRLMFAENTTASALHRFLRRRCVAWGSRWRYLSIPELRELLAGFSPIHVEYIGLLAAFGRREWQRSLLHSADVLVSPLVPRAWRYVAAGWAVKNPS